jgi:hypothetical protein
VGDIVTNEETHTAGGSPLTAVIRARRRSISFIHTVKPRTPKARCPGCCPGLIIPIQGPGEPGHMSLLLRISRANDPRADRIQTGYLGMRIQKDPDLSIWPDVS